MKRKMFLIVISVLVLCLTCGMLFVACNDKNEGNDNGGKNPGEIDIPDTAADILTEVVKNFGEVKADTTGAKEFNLGLDITDADNKPVFSLVFETIDGDDFIYASVGDDAMTKFNGLDLGGTVETVLSWFGSGLSIAGTSIPFDADAFIASGLIETVVELNVIGNFAKSSDGNSYSLQLNLSTIAGLLSGFEKTINDWIANSGYADIINTVIDAVYGLIIPEEATTSTEGGSDDASPATVTELVEAIADNYTLTFYFGFEDNTGKDAAAEKAAQPFGDLALSSKVMAAREADAQNLLNFTVDGTAEFKDEEGTVTNRYDIDVDIDLDIFPLIPALLDCVTTGPDENGNMMPNGFVVDDAKLEGIISAVKEMGYINITVDEVNLEDGSFVKNILTIHSNFAEGNAIVQLNGASVLIVDVGLGGVYDFDALAGYIADMIGGALSQADEGGEPAPEEPSLTDTILTVVKKLLVVPEGSIGDDLGSIDFEAILADISANGLTVKMSNIKSVLTDDLGLDLGLAGSFIGNVWENADTMNIKVESTSFGKAVRKDTPSITAINSSSSSALVSKITSVEGLPTKVLDASGIVCGLDQVYAMKGMSIATGEEVEFDGYVIGYSGLDLSATGVQDATFYVAASNIGSGLVGMLAGMIDLSAYPVFGIYEYTAQVEVVQVGEDSEITAEGIVGGTYIPVAKNSTIWSNIAITDPAYLVIDGEVKTAITSDSVQVYTEDGTLIPTTDTTVFDENGNIIKEGRYEVRLVKDTMAYSFDIQVIEITSSTKAEYVAAEGTDPSILTDGIVHKRQYRRQ